MWCALWIAVGLQVASDIRGLKRLSETVIEVGAAAEETGRALETLDQLPVVGERVGPAAESIAAAGRSAIASGEESRDSVDRTSVLLGFAIAIIPVVPIAALYVPYRARRFRVTRVR